MRIIKRFWATMLVLAAICWLTLSPEPVGKVHIVLFAGADKVAHACMMAGLTAAILFDLWRQDRRKLSDKALLLTAVAVTLFSAADEWAQGVMGLGRTIDIYDFVADLTGMMLALLLVPTLLSSIRAKAAGREEATPTTIESHREIAASASGVEEVLPTTHEVKHVASRSGVEEVLPTTTKSRREKR